MMEREIHGDDGEENNDEGEDGVEEHKREELIDNNGKLNIVPDLINNVAKLRKGTDPILYLKIVHEEGSTTALRLLYSFSGERGSFKQWLDKDLPPGRRIKSSEEVEAFTNITLNDMKELFGYTSIAYISRVLLHQYKLKPLDEGVSITRYNEHRKTPSIEYGYGIKTEKIPDIAHFGKLLIRLKRLYHENILSIKHRNKSSIGGLPNVKVSDKFVNIIMNLMENIHPRHEDINRLSTPERQLYDRIIHLASLQKTVPNAGDKTLNEMKKRLHLLEGEIEIGNNNPDIIKEIKKILSYLKALGAITPKQMNEYIKQFK